MAVDVAAEPIEADSATLWGEIAPPVDEDALAEALLDETAATPYMMNEEVNFRIALWQGDVTALKVDGIVSCNNEDLNERSGVSGQIFASAGPQLEEACTRLGGCAPGEAKATRGFRLPAKHVIHTVPPAWSDGQDAEATLERCYTASLNAALQLHCATVAFSCIKTKDAPREQAAHVALRTIRKLLEQPAYRGVQLLLFAMRPQDVYDAMVYENLLPLYFPRSASEEHDAARLLPLAVSNSLPAHQLAASGGAFATGAAVSVAETGYDPSPALASLTQPPRLEANGNYALGADLNAAKLSVATASMSAAQEKMLRGSAYASFLQRAGLADLSDIDAMQLFYRGGVDARGRPIFLFWAGHLPSRPVDLERVLMHIMRTLDAHVQGGYIIVYVHTSLSPENEPPFAWLRKVYDLFDRRLKDNLHLLYIVHPSWWLRMAMNFVKTFVSSGRGMDSKIVQLPHFADLFKRNYFTPGTLRMPDSPLVRKYLEMSNDVHMLDSIMGADEATREARAEALASAVSSGAVPGGANLQPGLPPAQRAAVAIAAAEKAASSDEYGHELAQAKASKEILLKQLIELSDQLASHRTTSDEMELRLGSVQAAKDKEINRLSNALYDAHKEVDEAKRKLEAVHSHAITMEDQRRERTDALAEIADLEGQLAQTQVYNHHMAKELISLHMRVRSDKWEMLHEMSSLERQLEAARALAHIQAGGGGAGGGGAGGGGAGGGDNVVTTTVTTQSRLEEIAKLHAALTAEREEVSSAMRAMNEQAAELEYALKRAAEEAAAMRGAEAARAAESEARQAELQQVAKDLEEKIGAIKTAAHIGASGQSESAMLKSRELSELEEIVLAAEEDVGRIEQKLSEPAGAGTSLPELMELRDLLTAQLRAHDGDGGIARQLEVLAQRKDAAMQAVAKQLVPEMNHLQATHEAEVKRFELMLNAPAPAGGAALGAEARRGLASEMEEEARKHEATLGQLESKAAEALAALEERFEAEAEGVQSKARARELERQRIASRLEGVEARMKGLELFPQTAEARVSTALVMGSSQGPELGAAEATAAKHVMALRHELSQANERMAELEDEREAMRLQLHSAKTAAEKLAEEARGAADAGGGMRAVNAMTMAAGGEGGADEADATYRVAASAHALSAELSRAPPPRSMAIPYSSEPVASEGGGGGASSSSSRAAEDDPFKVVEIYERQRVEIEAQLVVQGDAFAAASDSVGSAERRLDYLQRGGERSLGEAAERAALVAAHAALDEATSLRDELELRVEDLSSKLQALYPRLSQARQKHQTMRRKAEAALFDSATPLEEQARGVGSLPEARAHIEVLVERLREAERRARNPPSAAGAVAAAASPSDSSANGVHGSDAAPAAPTFMEAQVQYDEAKAELELERAEKRRLQQLVEDMKRGDMSAVFRQAQEDAEKEVLKRMLSTDFKL